MIKDAGNYNLFFDFIKTYLPVGFKEINRHDSIVLALEEMMKNNNQFFLVFDMLRMKSEFVSLRSIQMMGINPEELTAYHFKEATHPDDLKRHELGLSKLFKIAHELYITKTGYKIISTNFRFRNPTGSYVDHLIQCLFFYCPDPCNTVYVLHIYTDISWCNWCKKTRSGFHYYVGDDLSYFRYPDEELLMTGNIFSDREFEIIKLVHEGFDSEHIAEKLFLSKHTVNTHRKNILEKTGKAHISDLIYYLQERGEL
jgi:DNA-binding CsgD family transcriptional regulator